MPRQFGEWKEVRLGNVLVVNPQALMADRTRMPPPGEKKPSSPSAEADVGAWVPVGLKQCTPEKVLGYCGDTENKIHTDPEYAKRFGMRAPITAGNQMVNYLLDQNAKVDFASVDELGEVSGIGERDEEGNAVDALDFGWHAAHPDGTGLRSRLTWHRGSGTLVLFHPDCRGVEPLTCLLDEAEVRRLLDGWEHARSVAWVYERVGVRFSADVPPHRSGDGVLGQRRQARERIEKLRQRVVVGQGGMYADVLIHEAQYPNEEYVKKVGWGHSSISNACALAKLSGAKRWIITHHDPSHDDEFLQRKLNLTRQVLRSIDCDIEVSHAHDGMTELL